jgi:GNAT superfamily N-acetyltransferase
MQVFIIKVNMKDFIKHKLRESLETEKIDTSKIRVKSQFTNGLLVFLPVYDGNRMGSFRLEPFNDDYKIFGTVLYDKYKGQGLGKGMYKYIIRQLKKEGKKLYSDDNQSAEAVNVWNSLVKDGIATTTDNGYVSI